jgi:hypothetical protein
MNQYLIYANNQVINLADYIIKKMNFQPPSLRMSDMTIGWILFLAYYPLCYSMIVHLLTTLKITFSRKAKYTVKSQSSHEKSIC